MSGLHLHPHFVFEALAYASGFVLYRHLRRRQGDAISDTDRWTLIVAVVLGAAVGSKLLHYLTHFDQWAEFATDPVRLLGGKSIVGGLLGGLVAVEVTKKRLGIGRRTGDLYVFPILVGLALGRVGCFLSGLEDGTHGVATTLSIGVDYGDGVTRHPAQLYELVYLLALGVTLAFLARHLREGGLFRAFMVGYLAYRLGIGFIKPYPAIMGLNAIQWASFAGLTHYAWSAVRERRPGGERISPTLEGVVR